MSTTDKLASHREFAAKPHNIKVDWKTDEDGTRRYCADCSCGRKVIRYTKNATLLAERIEQHMEYLAAVKRRLTSAGS